MLELKRYILNIIMTSSISFDLFPGPYVTLTPGAVQTIHSANYPSDYRNNLDCTWFVTAPEGYAVVAEFMDFQLENKLELKVFYSF